MYGRKRIFQVSIAIFLAGSVFSGLAGNILWLSVFRALQGVGGGGLNSLVMAIIGDVIPPRERSKYQASLGIVATLALIAGPFLGGLFADHLSWRWIFYINIPIGVAALAIVGARLHLPRPTRSIGRIDYAGGLLATVFTSAVLLFTSWGGTDKHPWGSPLVLALIGLSVVSLVVYLLVERRAAEPITPLRLFRSSVFNISSLQFLIAAMVLFVAMLYVPMFLQFVQHRSAFEAGLFVIPMLVGLVAATAVSGPVISRTGRYKIYPIIGAILTGASMWVLGVATGTLNFFKSIGGAFGAALFGAILTHGLTTTTPPAAFHTVFLLTVPFMAIALILGLLMPEKPLSEEMKEVAEGKVEVPEY